MSYFFLLLLLLLLYAFTIVVIYVLKLAAIDANRKYCNYFNSRLFSLSLSLVSCYKQFFPTLKKRAHLLFFYLLLFLLLWLLLLIAVTVINVFFVCLKMQTSKLYAAGVIYGHTKTWTCIHLASQPASYTSIPKYSNNTIPF